MNNDRSDDSDDSEGYSERIKLGEAVDKQAMGYEGVCTKGISLCIHYPEVLSLYPLSLQLLSGCIVFFYSVPLVCICSNPQGLHNQKQ